MVMLVVLKVTYGQDYPNTIIFQNQSGEQALAKLIGLTSITVNVPDKENKTVNVAVGEYYILVRYGIKPEDYRYAKGDTFVVTETATQYSSIRITLHEVLGGDYSIRPISAQEFEMAQVIPVADTTSTKTYRTGFGYYYGYYVWRKSINTWVTDNSFEHITNQVDTARSGMKYLSLHFNIPATGPGPNLGGEKINDSKFPFTEYNLNLSDYKIQDKNNIVYCAMGGSLDGGQTYFKGELKHGTQFTITTYSLINKPGKKFYLSSIFFEIPECSDSLIFYYKKQSLLIPQILLKVSPEIMNVVNSWHDEFVFLVKPDESIQNCEEIKSRDVHIWWTGEDDANKLTRFLKAIGKAEKMTLYGNNVWESWSDVLRNKNITIFMDVETAGRLIEDYAVKQVRFYCPTFP
jgi:hypothetical protein